MILNEKTVLVIAGSHWQIPIIKKIKAMGYKAIVINPYENSPAFGYSDEHVLADILDRETCLAYAKDFHIDAVLSDQSDIAVPTVAFISEKMRLNTIGTEQASLYTNKTLMRRFCKENGFSSIEYVLCHHLEEAIDFFQTIKKNIIVKPIDSNSSRGVFIINSIEQLKEKFYDSLSFSKVEKAVLAERYIEGTEFTVDGIKTPDKHFSLAISQKKHYPNNPNVASQLFFSHSNNFYDYELLKKQNDSYVNQSGLPFGLTHAEYKFEDGQFHLIEIAARGGGNLISSDIVPIMSGIDNYEYLINCSLGKYEKKNFTIDDKYKNRCAVLQFFEAPFDGGVIKNFEGIDYLDSLKNITSYKLNYGIGDKILPVTNDAVRVGFYIAYANSKHELETIIVNIRDTFKIILE